jgi:hypothetical protein
MALKPQKKEARMDWTHYILKFRLLAPMHIGYRKVGNLMQTRKYVPGKNLWAALTARVTRDYHDGRKSHEYKDIGDCAERQFRFGYLWPSFDGKNPCYFWDHKQNFDYLFLDSCTSAALDYSAFSTKEGSLHETEFVAPVTRKNEPVYLIGDLWAKKGKINADDWQISMEDLQLGGERSYGWGRLALCSKWIGNNSGHGKTATGYEWREDGGEIIMRLKRNDKITAHAGSFRESTAKDIVGPVEPLVGREWKEHPGQAICFAGVFFVPGCEVKKDNDFKLDTLGRWMPYEK